MRFISIPFKVRDPSGIWSGPTGLARRAGIGRHARGRPAGPAPRPRPALRPPRRAGAGRLAADAKSFQFQCLSLSASPLCAATDLLRLVILLGRLLPQRPHFAQTGLPVRVVLHNAPPPARDTARGAPSGARGLAHRSQATRGPRHTHGQHLAYTSLPPPPAASSAAYRDPWLRPKWCRDRSPWLHSTNPGSADTSASRCIQRAVGHHSVPMHAAADIARASARAKRSCHANGRTLDGAAIESMRGIRRIRVVAAPPAQRGFDGPPRFECRPEAPPPELVENGSTSAEHLPRGDSKICSASCMTPSASVSCSTGSPDDGARP